MQHKIEDTLDNVRIIRNFIQDWSSIDADRLADYFDMGTFMRAMKS